jgi:hypothetical protein
MCFDYFHERLVMNIRKLLMDFVFLKKKGVNKMVQKWRFEDIKLEWTHPVFGSFEKNSFVRSPDLNLVAGFSRILPGGNCEFGLHYNEIILVWDGEFEFTSSVPPNYEKWDTQIMKKGDIFFSPKGTQCKFKGLPGKTCILYYVTGPSSTK